MFKEIHIFDFDGTLVDSSHRYRTDKTGEKIDLQYWIDNEGKTLQDKVLPLTKKFTEICKASDKYAVIATARIWCHLSASFAYVNNLIPNGLVARMGRDDSRGGARLKTTYINRLLNLRQFANVTDIHVYEDNYSYLLEIMNVYKLKGYNVIGHYSPSNQGH
jgi:hypothetical protein